MLRLGVWRRDQFFASAPAHLPAYIYYRLSRSRVSLRLLDLPERPSASDIATFERLMPHVQLSTGVYRTTYKERFRNLNPQVNAVLEREFKEVRRPFIEDWAGSACLTSLEWFASLAPMFPQLAFTASDLVFYLLSVEDPNAGDAFVVEESGRPLQYEKPPFVVRMEPPEDWRFPLNRLWFERAIRKWRAGPQDLKIPDIWPDGKGDESVKQGALILRRLHLIHPAARSAAQTTIGEDRQFRLRRHSVFDRAPELCHAIRTMNVLNRAYFTPEQLLDGARAVRESLVPGGIWIVGRTVQEDPPVHQVSIFRKQDSADPTGKFTLLERQGPGSEIESLVLDRL